MKAAREGVGESSQLFVDAGASDAYWPNNLRWAINTSHMLAAYDAGLVRGSPEARCHRRFLRAPPPEPRAHRRRQSAHSQAKLYPMAAARRLRHCLSPTPPRMGGISEQRRNCLDGRDSASICQATAGTRRSVSPPICSSHAALPHVDVVEFIGGSPYVDGSLAEPFKLDGEGYLEIPISPAWVLRSIGRRWRAIRRPPIFCSRHP